MWLGKGIPESMREVKRVWTIHGETNLENLICAEGVP